MTRREDRLAALIAEATPLPWKMHEIGYIVARGRSISGIDTDGDARIVNDADAALISSSANALPAALAIIRAAREYRACEGAEPLNVDWEYLNWQSLANEKAQALDDAIAVWDKETT